MNSHLDLAHEASQRAWRLVTQHRSFDPVELHVTQLDRCRRKIHYQATNTPMTDSDAGSDGMRIDAHLGSAAHALYLPHLADAWPHTDATVQSCSVEYPLRLEHNGHTIMGSADIVAWCQIGTAWVWDAKTCEYSKWDAIAAGEIPTDHINQLARYARILERTHDVTVPRLFIYYLCRSDPMARKDFRRSRRYVTVEIDHTDAMRADVDATFAATFAAADSLTAAPRWFDDDTARNNTRYSPCSTCQWQTHCLGKPVACEDAGRQVHPDVAAELAQGLSHAKTDAAEAVSAVKEFIARHRDANDRKKVTGSLRELIDDLALEPGFYTHSNGTVYELHLSGGGQIVDQAAMKQMITDAGMEVPTKPRAQSIEARIHKPQ